MAFLAWLLWASSGRSLRLTMSGCAELKCDALVCRDDAQWTSHCAGCDDVTCGDACLYHSCDVCGVAKMGEAQSSGDDGFGYVTCDDARRADVSCDEARKDDDPIARERTCDVTSDVLSVDVASAWPHHGDARIANDGYASYGAAHLNGSSW